MNEELILSNLKEEVLCKYFKQRDKEDYFNRFVNEIKYLKNNINDSDYNKILEKLNDITSEKTIYKFYQFICEIMIGKHLLVNFKDTFKSEVRLIEGSKKDVDFQIKYNNITFNIEVKCPHLEKKDKFNLKNNKLKMNLISRVRSKEEYEELLRNITGDIGNKILDNSEYNGIEYGWLEDNKIKDFLISAQSKFKNCQSDNLNVLVIGLDSPNDIMEWTLYLTNISSGFLNYNSYEEHEHFDKVDMIVLSNMISGHRDFSKLDNFECWRMGNYYNNFFINQFGIRNKEINKEYMKDIYKRVFLNRENLKWIGKDDSLGDVMQKIYEMSFNVKDVTWQQMIDKFMEEAYKKKEVYYNLVGQMYMVKHMNNIPNNHLCNGYEYINYILPNDSIEVSNYRNEYLEKNKIEGYNEALEGYLIIQYICDKYDLLVRDNI